eukprot:5774971-Amphidinium_carterae.1
MDAGKIDKKKPMSKNRASRVDGGIDPEDICLKAFDRLPMIGSACQEHSVTQLLVCHRWDGCLCLALKDDL